MHIPDGMVNGAVCPVTTVVSIVGLSSAVYFAHTRRETISSSKFAAVSALVFAMQMLNFPVASGTSGHLLGGVLAASLLGIPLAVLAMAAVLTVQCVFFADGGACAWGANVLNMSLIGAGMGGAIKALMDRTRCPEAVSIAVAAFLSAMAAAFACTAEVALSGEISFGAMAPAMLGTHALIGIGEAVLTVALWGVLVEALSARTERKVTAGALGLAALAVMMSPFASNLPDGLESVAQALSLPSLDHIFTSAVFQDYHIAVMHNDAASTIAAGFVGMLLVGLSCEVLAKSLSRSPFRSS